MTTDRDLSTLSDDDLRRLACEVAGIGADGWSIRIRRHWEKETFISRPLESSKAASRFARECGSLLTMAKPFKAFPAVESDPGANDRMAKRMNKMGCQVDLTRWPDDRAQARLVKDKDGACTVTQWHTGMGDHAAQMAVARAVVDYGVDRELIELPEAE